ncbi:MAG: ATP-dependent metallopeptidase FtsH/Yme1/Tma family protein, partial [Christensenellaceae bacterium]|nr:ATP-dependent metallopeptidase FtsH/Yme1/Tma family protein [Christensenellaceae bacterium]
MKKTLRGPLVFIVIIAAIILLTTPLGESAHLDKKELSYTGFLEHIEQGSFSKVNVTGNPATALLKENSTVLDLTQFPAEYDYTTYVPTVGQFQADVLAALGQDKVTALELELDYEPIPEPSIWLELLPYLIPIALVGVLFYLTMRQSQGGGKASNFSKSRARMTMGEHTGKTFADVAGADEEQEELKEVV